MTVRALIELLKTYPANTEVVTDGYENGYNPIKKVEQIKIKENENKDWWDGKYDDDKSGKGIEVVFLNAESRKDNKLN